MSIFKPFITSDVIVSPFKVNKSFTFTGNELTGSNVQIDRFLGKNITASLWISGSDNTGYITSQSTVLAKIKINGNYLSGGGLVIKPGQRVFLEQLQLLKITVLFLIVPVCTKVINGFLTILLSYSLFVSGNFIPV